MGKITFILGGARSGKSQHALRLADDKRARVAFIATCLPLDEEMKERVELHKKKRPASWKTFEETLDIPALLKQIGHNFDIIIIDCLTLWVSNLLLKESKKEVVENKVDEMMDALKDIKGDSIIVSNEVGLGIVPENKLARDFRDVAGRANQIVAGKSKEVFFMIAGLPSKIK